MIQKPRKINQNVPFETKKSKQTYMLDLVNSTVIGINNLREEVEKKKKKNKVGEID